MQVYRRMNIGTAKPSAAECEELPHHLIDIHDINEQYSASEFSERADSCCAEIYSRGKLPVVLGGTGFYIRSFMLGLPETPESDACIRENLKKRAETEGLDVLYNELLETDAQSASVINPHDGYRIMRALEVYAITGKPRSCFRQSENLRAQYDFCAVILEREREDLYKRINTRVDDMFAAGLEAEFEDLKKSGCTKDMPGMQAIGYREFFTTDCAEKAAEMIKTDSRKYAKKQYTFMNGIPGAQIMPYNGSAESEIKIQEKIFSFIDRLHLT